MKTDKEKIIEEVLKDMRRKDNIVYDWILGEKEDIYIEKAISLTYDKAREQTRQETIKNVNKIILKLQNNSSITALGGLWFDTDDINDIIKDLKKFSEVKK